MVAMKFVPGWGEIVRFGVSAPGSVDFLLVPPKETALLTLLMVGNVD